MTEVRWVATLSDGNTIAEESGEWKEIPGERKPWVRLCEYVTKEKQFLTSLRLNVDGKTIHMPRGAFDRFDYLERSKTPNFYSLEYKAEATMSFSDDEGIKEERFIDLAAHYDGYAVHFIQGLSNPNISWIIVSDGTKRMATTPDRRLIEGK